MPKSNATTLWPFYAIIVSFLAPILLAYWLFFSGYGYNNTVNKGTLLATPGIPVSSDSKLPSKWIIAYLASADNIPKNLTTISKRWAALGKEQYRVVLATLHPYNQPPKDSPWLSTPVTTASWQKLSQQKTVGNQPCYYFLIDPSHHAILCYPETVTPKDIDTDLRKLLKYSRSG
jgi:hypothetical protein